MRRLARAAPAVLAAAALASAATGSRAGGPPWVLDFDEVPAGTVLNEAYAARGVHLRAFGDGFLNTIVADTACVAACSASNVVSLKPAGECPTYTDDAGWMRATFDLPQPRVSVCITNAGDGVASYLRAYQSGTLVEMAFGQSGPTWNGVPQTLEILRPAGHSPIDYVEFGAFRGSDPVQVDDLSYDLRPVAVDASSWSALKARFR